MASSQWAFLVHRDQQYQVDMLKDILQSRRIPVMVKSKGSGAYLQIYMGMTWTGFDLYVPEERLDDARQAINFLDAEPGMFEEDEPSNDQEKE